MDIWNSWNNNGNGVVISMNICWYFNETLMENHCIQLKIQWNTHGNPLEIQLDYNSNFNGIPVGLIINPIEISTIYQLKFQWIANRK